MYMQGIKKAARRRYVIPLGLEPRALPIKIGMLNPPSAINFLLFEIILFDQALNIVSGFHLLYLQFSFFRLSKCGKFFFISYQPGNAQSGKT